MDLQLTVSTGSLILGSSVNRDNERQQYTLLSPNTLAERLGASFRAGEKGAVTAGELDSRLDTQSLASGAARPG